MRRPACLSSVTTWHGLNHVAACWVGAARSTVAAARWDRLTGSWHDTSPVDCRSSRRRGPQLAGGVSVEGVGRGGSTTAAFDWITRAPQVFYWGDMDADGLEILNRFRSAGVPATSILMDPDSYETWERFGTSLDRHGKPLGPRPARPVPHLTEAEHTLYHQLIAPTWARHRRIEQERIPLTVALEQVNRRGASRGENEPPEALTDSRR
ncbi:Wadjet anti-phage system protein JetD domain-containing protein [Saccharopolyspora shandongensis]|uniref:Wadjet anti-phage system protein JetD domain-containing protein n=1 Tax=Saccharopolyspora shandongensis TaxID=418495 RepID=UPI0033EE43B8